MVILKKLCMNIKLFDTYWIILAPELCSLVNVSNSFKSSLKCHPFRSNKWRGHFPNWASVTEEIIEFDMTFLVPVEAFWARLVAPSVGQILISIFGQVKTQEQLKNQQITN